MTWLDDEDGEEGWPNGEDGCSCGLEGPDEFGNYDLLESSGCLLHGVGDDEDAAA